MGGFTSPRAEGRHLGAGPEMGWAERRLTSVSLPLFTQEGQIELTAEVGGWRGSLGATLETGMARPLGFGTASAITEGGEEPGGHRATAVWGGDWVSKSEKSPERKKNSENWEGKGKGQQSGLNWWFFRQVFSRVDLRTSKKMSQVGNDFLKNIYLFHCSGS